MIKLIIFFRKPANVDTVNAFEDRFASHVQLINAMPNVKRTVVNRAIGAPRGEPAYYLIHEVFFADMAAANYALNTAEGRAAGADLMSFAREISSMLFAEVWGEDPAPELPTAADAAAAAVAAITHAAPLEAPAPEKVFTIDDIIAANTPAVPAANSEEAILAAVMKVAEPVEAANPTSAVLGETLPSQITEEQNRI